MAAFRKTIFAGLAIVALSTSCQQDGGNAESCGADGHVDSVASSQLSLLQTNLIVKNASSEPEVTVGKNIPVQVVQRAPRETDSVPTPINPIAPTDEIGLSSTPAEAEDAPATSEDAPATFEDVPATSEVAGTSKCTPTCTWKCSTPVCDEVCTPTCQAPRCQTRCNGMITESCKMDCEEPNCAVVCPERGCAAQTCHACTTNCSKPMCKLNCPEAQDCSEVCETPVCAWDCKAPQRCPKPDCHMECEKPRTCLTSTSTKDMPPLAEGQQVIRDFETPLSLLQTIGSPLMPVKVLKATSVAGSDKLKLIESIVHIAVA